MIFAVNYSLPTAALLQDGKIRFDRFKSPAWPDLVQEAQAYLPVYVHFPLKIGWGKGTAQDGETNLPVDWKRIDSLLAQTETPLVNLHLSPYREGAFALPADPKMASERVVERAVRDARAVVERYGAERVIVENESPSLEADPLLPVYQPENIRRVIEEAGCGLLLDLSHARLAAKMLGIDPKDYIRRLPVERLREIHLTGIQHFGQSWVERLRQDGIEEREIALFAGREMDHLPLEEADWQFAAWALEQVHQGEWAEPWVVTLEYGGVGPFWSSVTLPEVLADQVPRLFELVHRNGQAR